MTGKLRKLLAGFMVAAEIITCMPVNALAEMSDDIILVQSNAGNEDDIALIQEDTSIADENSVLESEGLLEDEDREVLNQEMLEPESGEVLGQDTIESDDGIVLNQDTIESDNGTVLNPQDTMEAEDKAGLTQESVFDNRKAEQISKRIVIEDANLDDTDSLLEGYLNQLIQSKTEKKRINEIPAEGVDRKEYIGGANQFIYDVLSEEIKQAAKGELDSAVFETGNIKISDYSDKTEFTKDELGVSDLNSEEAIFNALRIVGFDMSKVLYALLADYPYELYWFDKSTGFNYTFNTNTYIEDDNLHIEEVAYTITMYVSSDYSKTGEKETTDIDTAKTGAADRTVAKAKEVVAQAVTDGCNTDYEKLKYYKEYICNEVEYDHNAMGGAKNYGDPWQIIYVFDGDKDTKVVCEGYAKAFKLLCDLSDFDYPELDCYLMTGDAGVNSAMKEPHMWNVVHMDDGENYLVDVTNSDQSDGSIDNRLFLVGYNTLNNQGYTVFRPKFYHTYSYTDESGDTVTFQLGDFEDIVTYIYEQNCISIYSEDERRINSANYLDSLDPIVVTLDANGGIIENNTVIVSYYSEYGNLPILQREDYFFDGWYTAITGGAKVEKDTIVKNPDDHTLYAHWTKETEFSLSDYEYDLDESQKSVFLKRYIGDAVNIIVPAKVIINSEEYRVIVDLNLEDENYYYYSDESGKESVYQNTAIKNIAFHGGVTILNAKILFAGCKSLESVDLSGADTSETISMEGMFYNCKQLKNINLTGICTNNVNCMMYMFGHCESLENLDVSKFVTSNVERMDGMFISCHSLAHIDVSSFDTSNVWSMSGMFCDCRSLEEIDVGNFNTSKVEEMGLMFSGCHEIKELDLSNFNTANVTHMYSMFNECLKLKYINLSSFDTSNVQTMDWMFARLESIEKLDIRNFNTSKVRNMHYMFRDCKNLKSLDLSNFDTSSTTDMEAMFRNCCKLKSLDISNFNTSRVETMFGMFDSCYNLDVLDVSSFDTSNVENFGEMFYGVQSVRSLDVSRFDTSKATDVSYMFTLCALLEELDLSNFDLSKATKTDYMLAECYPDLIKTPLNLSTDVDLYTEYQDALGNKYTSLPKDKTESINLTTYASMLESIEIEHQVYQITINANIDGWHKLNYIKNPTTADTNYEVWKSSDSNVVDVYKFEGEWGMKGLSPGTAIITCRVNGKTATAKVTVTPILVKKDADVSIAEGDSVIKNYGDNSFGFNVTARNRGGGKGVWTWESSNTAVATVSNTGAVTITGTGETVINAHYESDTTVGEATVTLNVNPKTLGLSWSNTSFDYDGSTHKPTATLSGVKSGDDCTVSVSGEQANAGTYTATATLGGSASDNYIIPDDKKTCSFTINKVPISGAAVTIGSALTYTGSEQTQTVSKVMLSGNEVPSSDYTVTNNKGINAGSYTLTVTAKENSNYTGSVTKEFTIGKKAITPTITVTGSYSFTGNEIAPAYSVKDGNTPLIDSDYTASLSNNTNAGTGKITVTEKTGGNYSFSPVTQNFTISKAAAKDLTDIQAEQTYTKTSVSGSVAGKMPTDAGTLNFTAGTVAITKVSGSTTAVSGFAVDDKGSVSATISNGTAGDVITLPVTISSTNYEDSTVNVVVTLLAKSDAAVSITENSPITKTYGDSGFTLTAAAGNKGTGTGVWTWESSNTAVATVSNTGAVTITGTGETVIKAHYESDTTVGEAAVTLNVNPKTLGLSWSNTSFDYNGSTHKPTATLSGVKSGDDCTVSVSGEQANAGTYTATAALSGAASGNYALPEDKKTCSFIINKIGISGAAVTLGSALTYTGSEQTQTVSKVTVNGKDIAATDYTVTNNKGINAGSYTLTVTAKENSNYTGSVTKEFTIGKKAITPTITVTGNYSFTGSEIAPTYSIKDGNTSLTVSDYTASLSDNTNAGTGKITVSATEGGNYSFSPVTQNFTISKAAAKNLTDIQAEQTYTKTSVSESVAGKMPADAGTLNYTAGTAAITKVSGSTTAVSGFAVDDKGNVSATVTNGTAGDVITLPVTISSTNYEDSTVNVVVTLLAKSDAAVSITENSPITKTYGDGGFTLNADAGNKGTGTGVWTWESFNTAVATVSNTGAVTITGAGETVIKAHYESDTTVGEAAIVINVNAKLLSITWSNTSFIYDGASHKPTATLTGVINGDDCTVSVSGEQTEEGTYTATAALNGTASINYVLSDDNTTCSYTISKVIVSNVEITGAVDPVSMQKGETIQLGVIVTPGNATNTTVTWSSSDPAVVTVDNTGLITAVTVGEAVITAEANDGSGVKAALGITVFEDNDNLYVEFAEGMDYTYTGKPVTPLVKVYNRGRLLMQETDYTVKYSNNVNANDGTNEKKAPKAVVTGKTIAASAEAVFRILPKDIGDETSVYAEEVNIISGKTATPLLYYGGTKLGTKDLINPYAKDKFTESRAITVSGTGNFTGKREVFINVRGAAEIKSIPKIKVLTFKPDKRFYNGQPQYIGKDEIIVVSASDKNKTPLVMDKDFFIVYPDDVTNAGTVKITVIGKGDYVGSVGKSYQIDPAKSGEAIKNVNITFPDAEGKTDTYDSFEYKPGGVLPAVEILVTHSNGKTETLAAGRDYKVTYKDNTKAGAANKNKPATATITFLGNYKSLGKMTKNFYIDQADLGRANTYAMDKVVNKAQPKYPISEAVADIDGTTVNKKEYTVTYKVNDGEKDTEVTSKDKLYKALAPGESIAVTVEIKAKTDKNGALTGNYKGTAPVCRYNITRTDADHDLSKATVIIQNKGDASHKAVTQLGFTGKPIKIGSGEYSSYELYVYVGKKSAPIVLTEGTDFSVDYSNNVNAGKATVMINGCPGGKYCGSKTFTFKIVKGRILWAR